MPINIPSSQNSLDLLAALQGIDISVPERTDGRTTDHTETWTGSRLLSTLAKANRLTFPVSVVHRDRPDILLECDGSKIGIEITEAISPQYAAYCALAEREFPDALLEPAHFRWDAPQLSVAQMRQLLSQSQMSSDGWAGDRPEQEWALFIRSAVDAKLVKLSSPGFDKFDQNWLAVYDNLPFLDIDVAKAVEFLLPLLRDRWLVQPRFHVLFIECGRDIVRLDANRSEQLPLHDVWQ